MKGKGAFKKSNALFLGQPLPYCLMIYLMSDKCYNYFVYTNDTINFKLFKIFLQILELR